MHVISAFVAGHAKLRSFWNSLIRLACKILVLVKNNGHCFSNLHTRFKNFDWCVVNEMGKFGLVNCWNRDFLMFVLAWCSTYLCLQNKMPGLMLLSFSLGTSVHTWGNTTLWVPPEVMWTESLPRTAAWPLTKWGNTSSVLRSLWACIWKEKLATQLTKEWRKAGSPTERAAQFEVDHSKKTYNRNRFIEWVCKKRIELKINFDNVPWF